MDNQRQKSDGWLEPGLGARISCHEITWLPSGQIRPMQSDKARVMPTGGNLYFHKVPISGTAPQTRDFAQIVLLVTGSVVQKVNGERRLLSAGDICFLRPDDLNSYVPNPERSLVELVTIDYDLDCFLSLSVLFEDDRFLQQLTAPVLPPCFQMDANACGNLYTRLLKLNTPALSPTLRKIKLKLLLGELFARFFIDEDNLQRESQVPDWLVSLCAAMREEKNFIAGLPRLHKLACRTPGHVCKSFQKYLGRRPTEYINELRLAHAARQLSDTDDDIVVIATRLNFSSLSWFYRLFQQRYGVSPAAYRRLHSTVRGV
ncbi:MAG: AraC family transcriptional regulator [Lentisphaerae bacterium]|jgi:AraC family cel operon transcriptional repressor|nr:AraC family transcriptional regulator [Lentisphaerota bacterium]